MRIFCFSEKADVSAKLARNRSTTIIHISKFRARRFVDLGYADTFGSDWYFRGNITYNGMDNTAYLIGGTQRFFTTQSRGHLIELQMNHAPMADLDLVFGGVFDQLKGENVSDLVRNTKIDIARSSLFAQADYRGTDWLKFNAGLQLNKPEGGEHDFSPRLGSIFEVTDAVTAKLLYGKAFRSPFGLDLFLNAAFLRGNPNLEPETIRTYSAELLYRVSDLQLGLTLYDSQHDDLIVRNTTTTPVSLTNAGQMNYHGAELEYQIQLTSRLSAQGNLSWQTNETDTGKRDTTFQPNWMLKSGLAYHGEAWLTGLFASYFGEPTPTRRLNPTVREVNTDATSYVMVTANLELDLAVLLENAALTNAKLTLYVDNLLDEAVYYPEFSRLRVNTIPHHAGRGFYLNFAYRF